MQTLLSRYNAKDKVTVEGRLTDTCLDGQDVFVKLLDVLEIPYEVKNSEKT